MRPLLLVIAVGACGSPPRPDPANASNTHANHAGTVQATATAATTSTPTTAAQTATSTAAQPATSAPRIAMLAQLGDLYVLIADGKTTYCERWHVNPDESLLTSQPVIAGKLASDSIAFRVDAMKLELQGYSREYSEDVSASTTCNSTFDVHETTRGLVVGDAIWFRTQQGCTDAIKNHERVATDLDCRVVEESPNNVKRASRTKFETLLARGGTLFSIVEGPQGQHCSPVRVSPGTGSPRNQLEGDFEVAVVRDDGIKGTRALTYQFRRGADTITLLGPGTTWRDGSAEAFG